MPHAAYMLMNAFVDQVRGILPSGRQLLVRRLRDLIRVSLTRSGGRSRLAGENELMDEFDAPRDVIREALALLTDEGVIERRRGLGTRSTLDHFQISAHLPPPGITLESYLHSGELAPKLLFWGWVTAPVAVFETLDGVEDGDECLCIDYVQMQDGRPSGTITNYLRAAEGSRITPRDFFEDFYSLLERGGGDFASHDMTLQPTTADAHVAALLNIMPREPVMWFEQVIRNSVGEAIDFAVGHMPRHVRMQLTAVPRIGTASSAQGRGVLQ